VVLDDVLEMGGLVALRQLKAQPTTAAIPVVVITSIQAYQVSAQEAKTLGATTFLTKPFSLPSLLAEVRKVLGEPAQT
jgi:CheY-like chemotaxis protein